MFCGLRVERNLTLRGTTKCIFFPGQVDTVCYAIFNSKSDGTISNSIRLIVTNLL